MLILHIPHASTTIPLREGFIASDSLLRDEIVKLTDWHTDDLFQNFCDQSVIAPFSRIFCDVERFKNNADEVMAQFGMGMLYTHLDNGEVMREISPSLREKIVNHYYDPHHARLENLTETLLVESNFVTIVDCHSFP